MSARPALNLARNRAASKLDHSGSGRNLLFDAQAGPVRKAEEQVLNLKEAQPLQFRAFEHACSGILG